MGHQGDQDDRRDWRAWLAPAGLDRWSILLVLAVHLSFFPFFPAMHSANELSRLYLAYALVDDHDVEITSKVRRYGDINDKARVALSLFSDKPPGTAFVAAPFIAARRALGGEPDLRADTFLARLAVGILPTLFLLVLLRREMKELGVRAPTRALALVAYGLGTLGFTYSLVYYGHQLTAVLLYAVWFLLRRGPVTPVRAAGAGFLGALCLSTEYQSALYLLPLVVAFAWRTRPLGSGLVAAAAGTVLPLTALLLYHDAAFGHPLKTGYSYVANPFFANVHEQGFMGVLTPRLEPFLNSLGGSSKGLLFYSPFLVLGFLGLVSYARSAGTAGTVVLRYVLVALPLLFVSSMAYWDGGWTVGQRHWTPLVPFLMAPAALLIHRSVAARILAPGLMVASVGVTGLATVVYPHLPQWIANPFHDLTLPLLAGGCLADAWWANAWLAAGIFVAALFLLALAVVSLWPDSLARKAVTVVVLALLPLAWFDGTSRVERLPPGKALAEQRYFVNQCKKAGRWERAVKTPAPRDLQRLRRRLRP